MKIPLEFCAVQFELFKIRRVYQTGNKKRGRRECMGVWDFAWDGRTGEPPSGGSTSLRDGRQRHGQIRSNHSFSCPKARRKLRTKPIAMRRAFALPPLSLRPFLHKPTAPPSGVIVRFALPAPLTPFAPPSHQMVACFKTSQLVYASKYLDNRDLTAPVFSICCIFLNLLIIMTLQLSSLIS